MTHRRSNPPQLRVCPTFVWSRVTVACCAACRAPYWDHTHESAHRTDDRGLVVFRRPIQAARAARIRTGARGHA